MGKCYKDIDEEKFEELKKISCKISNDLFAEGFSKDSIYIFLHTTVDCGLYRAEIHELLEEK